MKETDKLVCIEISTKKMADTWPTGNQPKIMKRQSRSRLHSEREVLGLTYPTL